MTKKFGAGIAVGIVGMILVAVAVWLIVVYTGAYNVAASDQHADAVRWTLDTTMHRSVARRAGGIELPENPSRDLLAEGAGHYAESCAHCHGAPGQNPAEWSRGMRPEPPHLTEAATEWTPEEIHWIVANGIKMSGMPAFGQHHSPSRSLHLPPSSARSRGSRLTIMQRWPIPLQNTRNRRHLRPQASRRAELQNRPSNSPIEQERKTCPTSASA